MSRLWGPDDEHALLDLRAAARRTTAGGVRRPAVPAPARSGPSAVETPARTLVPGLRGRASRQLGPDARPRDPARAGRRWAGRAERLGAVPIVQLEEAGTGLNGLLAEVGDHPGGTHRGVRHPASRLPRLLRGRTPARFFRPAAGSSSLAGREAPGASTVALIGCGEPTVAPPSTWREATIRRRDAGAEVIHAQGAEAQVGPTEHRAPRRRRGAIRRAIAVARAAEAALRMARDHEAQLDAVLELAGAARDGRVARPRHARAPLDAVRRARTGPARAPEAPEGRLGQGHPARFARRRGFAGPDAPLRVLHGHRAARRGDPAARGPRREAHEVATDPRNGGRSR